ncbi:MAG: hypothetical protein HY744_31685 [Deltaproteobacteria bacterium]|nr:hypothetical protein [Deltaproteobacteria bacterium]
MAKLDADGNELWSKRFGDELEQSALGVAVDEAGNVFVTGEFAGTIDWGGPEGPLASAGGTDIFLAKLDPDGEPLWGRRFGGKGADRSRAVAADPFGNVVLAGDSDGALDFGGGPLAAAGGADAFVAKLGGAGTHLWSRRFGDAEEQAAASVATDWEGTIALGGSLAGSADFGGGKLVSAGASDAFVALLER